MSMLYDTIFFLLCQVIQVLIVFSNLHNSLGKFFLFLFEGLELLNKAVRTETLGNNNVMNFCSNENFNAIKQFLYNKKNNLSKFILNKDYIIKNELSMDL